MARLLTSLIVAAALLPAAASAAPNGSFSGTLGLKLQKGATAEVRAINSADGSVAGVGGVSRSGAFKLSLPAGRYLVVGSVLPKPGRGAKLTQTRVALSLKAGQKRTKAKLTARKRRKPVKKKRRARASYIQEKGQVTAGSVAVEIPAFSGATGELSVMNKGMAALLITDVVGTGGAGDDCDVAVLEVEHRADIIKELEFQQSPYVDPSTRVERNFVIDDVEVRGTLKNGAGDKTLDYDVRLVDKRSGEEVGRLTGSMDTADVFAAEEKFAKELNAELCKLSDTYEVTMHVDGAASFATHSAGGTLDAKLTVKRTGKKSRIWKGAGTLGWAGTSYASTIGCSYLNLLEPTVPWNVTLTNLGTGDALVEWAVSGNDMATASIKCPGNPPPPAIPGQPGPSLLQTTPTQFQLPIAGGVQPLSGGFSTADGGWTNTGTITVRPAGVARMD